MNENNEVVESAEVQPIISSDEKPAKASRPKKPRTNVAAGDRTEVEVNLLTNLKERPVILEVYPEDVDIPVNKDHPLYDRRAEEPLDQAILNDIRERGILDMIKVRRKPEEEDAFEIVDGRTRLRCARQINRDRDAAKKPALKILVEVVPCSNDLLACELKHLFNEHRNERDPYGRAEGMFDMLSRGADKHDVAHVFKCNVKTVTRSKKLMLACDEVKEAAKDGVITMVESYDIADHPLAEQPEILKAFLDAKNALAESINPKRQEDKEEQSSGPSKPAKKQRKSLPWKKVFDLYKGLSKQKFNDSKPRHTDADVASVAALAIDFMGGGGEKAKKKFFEALEGIGFQTTPEDGELRPRWQAPGVRALRVALGHRVPEGEQNERESIHPHRGRPAHTGHILQSWMASHACSRPGEHGGHAVYQHRARDTDGCMEQSVHRAERWPSCQRQAPARDAGGRGCPVSPVGDL